MREPIQGHRFFGRYHVTTCSEVKLSRRNAILQGIWCEIIFKRVLAAEVDLLLALMTSGMLKYLPSVWEPVFLLFEKRWQWLGFECCFGQYSSHLGLAGFLVLAAHVD